MSRITDLLDPRLQPSVAPVCGELTLKNISIYNDDGQELKANIHYEWIYTDDGLNVQDCKIQFLTVSDISAAILKDECIDKLYWSTTDDSKWWDVKEIKIVAEI